MFCVCFFVRQILGLVFRQLVFFWLLLSSLCGRVLLDFSLLVLRCGLFCLGGRSKLRRWLRIIVR